MSSDPRSGPGFSGCSRNAEYKNEVIRELPGPHPPCPLRFRQRRDAQPCQDGLEKSCSDTPRSGTGLSAREVLPEGHQLRPSASSKSDFPPASLSQSPQGGPIFPETCPLREEGLSGSCGPRAPCTSQCPSWRGGAREGTCICPVRQGAHLPDLMSPRELSRTLLCSSHA